MSTVAVLVGTDHHPFTRLVRWADEWQGRHPMHCIVVQYGHTEAPRVAAGVQFMEPDDLVSLVRQSDAVVTHGGPGTLMTARLSGRRPILIPREASRAEHVDDHQVRFAEWVAAKRLATVTRDVDRLGYILEASLTDPVVVSAEHDSLSAPAELMRLIDMVRRGGAPQRQGPERK